MNPLILKVKRLIDILPLWSVDSSYVDKDSSLRQINSYVTREEKVVARPGPEI